MSKSIDGDEKKAAALIALSKFLLSYLVPYILASKTENERFGRTRNADSPGEVVPYICLNTPSKNKFGNPYEATVFHYLTAMIRGVEDEQIHYLFQSYEEEAKWYIKHRSFAYDNTPSVRRCKELFGTDVTPANYKDHFEVIKENVALNQDLLFAVEEATINRFVRYHPLRMNSNAMSIVSLVKRFVAMSATPTEGLLHHSLQGEDRTYIDEAVNPSVIHALISKGEEIGFLDSSNTTKMIADIIDADQESNGLLDLGSQFIDIDNDAVAAELLKQLEKRGIDSVVYYTRHNGSSTADYPAILHRGDKKRRVIADLTKKELAKYGLEPGNFFLFLDKRHCTGIDAPALPTAKYTILWGTEITLDDGTQGIMRLRQFLNCQKIKILFHNAEATLMPTIVDGVPFKDLPTLSQYKALLKQMLTKQAESIANKKLKAFRKMLSNACITATRRKLLEDEITDQRSELIKRVALLRAAESLIFINSEDRPFESFGSLEEEHPVLAVLQKERDILMASFSTALRKSGAEYMGIFDEVLTECNQIMELAARSEKQFLQSVGKAITRLNALEEDEETEVETLLQIFEEEEVELELEEEIEEELNRMQGGIPETDREMPDFDPYTFWQEQLDHFDNPTSAVPMQSVYTQAYYPPGYKKEYGLVFDKRLFATMEHVQPYVEKSSPFSRSMPPATYLMIMKDPRTNEHKGVVLSQRQAEMLKLEMQRAPERFPNTWIVLPKSLFHAGNPESLDVDDETVRRLLLEMNILRGNLDYCLQHLNVYTHWLTSDPDLQDIKESFVKLIYAKHQVLLTREHLKLASEDELEKMIARDREFEIYGELSNVSVDQIGGWTASDRRLVPCLNSKEQIQALPPELHSAITPEQMKFLTFEQMLQFNTAKYIRRYPEEAVKKLRRAHVDQKFVNCLTREQIKFIRDPKIIPLVTNTKYKFLDPRLTKHIPHRPGLINDLTLEQIAQCSKKQLRKWAKDKKSIKRMQEIHNPKDLALIVRAGFRALTLEQIALLSDEEAIMAMPDSFIAKLVPTKIMALKKPALIARLNRFQAKYVNPDLVVHLTPNAIRGLDSRVHFGKLNLSQLRTATAEQIELASPLQSLAYLVMTTALALFSIAIFVPVGIAYLLNKIIACQYFSAAFTFVMDSLKRCVSMVTYIVTQIFTCGSNSAFPIEKDTEYRRVQNIENQRRMNRLPKATA